MATTQLSSAFGEGGNWPQTAPSEIAEQSELHKEMARERELVRAIYNGTESMRNQGMTYLPKEPNETQRAYEHRLDRTFLYNAIGRTVQILAGKPFSKPIEIGLDIPEPVLDWLDNIDNTGRNINIFARDCFTDALIDGISYILPEMQAAPKDSQGNIIKISKAEAKRRNKRVYWVQYAADEVLGWRSEIRNGKPFLTQVRLTARIPIARGRFTEELVQAIYVLVPGAWAVYVPVPDDKEQRYLLHDNGPTSLDYIPLVPIYTGRMEFMMARPPLLDMAWLNLAHWQSASDQRHILHIARVPLLFAKNFRLKPGETIEIGPNRLITANSKDAELKYVEIGGAAVEAGERDLQKLEDLMGDFAMRLLVPKTGDITATQTSVEAAEAHSTLQSWAEGLSGSLNSALAYSADMFGITEPAGTLTVHTDFGVSIHDAAIAKEIREAEAAKQISRETFWSEWRRREILSDAFDAEEEKERLEAEGESEMQRGGGLAELLSSLGGAPPTSPPSQEEEEATLRSQTPERQTGGANDEAGA